LSCSGNCSGCRAFLRSFPAPASLNRVGRLRCHTLCMSDPLLTDERLKTLHSLMLVLLCGVSVPEHHLDSGVA